MNQRTRNTIRGFTLIELLTTISVLAITVAIAAPSLGKLLSAQRVRSLAYSMVSDLVLARSEAVKRGESVTLKPSTTSWSQGWDISVVSSAEIISTQSTAGSDVQITTVPASLPSLTFNRNGRLETPNIVRFGITDGGSQSRCISLDPSGRPKSTTSVCPS